MHRLHRTPGCARGVRAPVASQAVRSSADRPQASALSVCATEHTDERARVIGAWPRQRMRQGEGRACRMATSASPSRPQRATERAWRAWLPQRRCRSAATSTLVSRHAERRSVASVARAAPPSTPLTIGDKATAAPRTWPWAVHMDGAKVGRPAGRSGGRKGAGRRKSIGSAGRVGSAALTSSSASAVHARSASPRRCEPRAPTCPIASRNRRGSVRSRVYVAEEA